MMITRINTVRERIQIKRRIAHDLLHSNQMEQVLKAHRLESEADGMETALYLLLQNPQSQAVTDRAIKYLSKKVEEQEQKAA